MSVRLFEGRRQSVVAVVRDYCPRARLGASASATAV